MSSNAVQGCIVGLSASSKARYQPALLVCGASLKHPRTERLHGTIVRNLLGLIPSLPKGVYVLPVDDAGNMVNLVWSRRPPEGCGSRVAPSPVCYASSYD
ncbi:uncharacterized protein MCYG_06240 [Microsporum canis CBS 113480]|uniref:Uncharacterized protein n=1 Tax=Arthroderma otae (strain ATCC MYA-4605 / CBS 113480) TaxID=554155 RepID=C5FU37_ARTOC|nr:uncharacterized protein MCYG_06240 [Microsporum canis CBS 113480]EEQ33421.1 predicted protein [Microsporum canis CBS 113480]